MAVLTHRGETSESRKSTNFLLEYFNRVQHIWTARLEELQTLKRGVADSKSSHDEAFGNIICLGLSNIRYREQGM